MAATNLPSDSEQSVPLSDISQIVKNPKNFDESYFFMVKFIVFLYENYWLATIISALRKY